MADATETAAVAPPGADRCPEALPTGAACVDLSRSERLGTLMQMVAALSRASAPREVLAEFQAGFDRLYGPQAYVSLSVRGLEPGQYKITRLITGDAGDGLHRADPWRDWHKLPVHRGGLLGRIVRTAYPQIIHRLELRDDPVVGDRLARYGSLMAIPLFDGGEPLNWSITLREDPEGFSVEELEESVLRFNLGGSAVRNAVIAQELREAHAAIRREVDQIARIQRSLLPGQVPEIPGLQIGVNYETFDQAGGDMYALRPLRPLGRGDLVSADCCDRAGPWGILVADVSGHGPAAAVVMAMMQAILEAYPREPAGPAEVLEHANRHLCAKRIESRFVTAFFAIYDPKTRRLNYARAGHNPPVLMQPAADGWAMSRLEAVGGIPLGIEEPVTYAETTVALSPGETVVLYTDGVTEAVSPDGRQFGVEGIEGALTECTGEPQCVIGHITAGLREHQQNVRPDDDQTLVALRAV